VTAQSTITLSALDGEPAIRHAFFTRQGGVSGGMFASLNCGFGSGDDLNAVARNRAIAAAQLDLPPERLVSCHQIHGTNVMTVEQPWRREDNPRADGTVTKVPGIALGVLAADCAPVLLADPEAGVIGAAHGGWRGTLAGIMEATVTAMVALGARTDRIRAGIGPCIGQPSYEVGPEFPANFAAVDPASAAFFLPAPRPGHFLFDLPGYIALRLQRLGLAAVERAPHDTAAEEDLFFSYRRACLRGERDYGRGLAAIALTG
jgi:purine-nucleoside/S-methyl-5'-thioadenosine phosphorylase / adenosine deaminase